jgi:hypothetical protein
VDGQAWGRDLMHLATSDAGAILDLLADVDTIGADEPSSAAFLARLRDVVPCVDFTFQNADVEARRFIAMMSEKRCGPTCEPEKRARRRGSADRLRACSTSRLAI